MIDDVEARSWARAFGVDISQVRRDHLISHVLHALTQIEDIADAVFIGGTALCRTHLEDLRVSEDIDLLVHDVERTVNAITRPVGRLLRREYPDIAVTGPSPAPRGRRLRLTAPDVPGIEVQLIVRQAEDEALKVDATAVALRYQGLPATIEMLVPSPESFVAMKYLAYRDRREPRDLFDLAHLALRGVFDASAARLIAQVSGAPPLAAEVQRLAPATAMTWDDQLAHQATDLMSADSALRIVRDAVERLDID